jgi:hypothetical protein
LERQHDGNYHSRSIGNILCFRGHFRNLGNPCDHEGEDMMTHATHTQGPWPDLLAASEAFISELDSGSDFTAWEKAKANLREAIAKAKGA